MIVKLDIFAGVALPVNPERLVQVERCHFVEHDIGEIGLILSKVCLSGRSCIGHSCGGSQPLAHPGRCPYLKHRGGLSLS